MTVLQLKHVLKTCAISQLDLERITGVSRPRLNELVNHGHWPRGVNREQLKKKIANGVKRAGGDTRGLFKPCNDKAPAHPSAAPTKAPLPPITTSPDDDEEIMLLRKQSLTPETRRHFQLPRDPFCDPTTHEEVFLNSDLRYVRETMYQVARHGGFLAVIGESGAGKSTLREDLVGRIQREEQAVIIVEPYVLAMEAQDKVGKTLRSHHLAEAIMAAIAPLAKTVSSPEARFRQLHTSLRDSARAGHSHVLMIEEAHCLPLATLKHLKRYRELKDGLRPLLSIILLGQPELAVKLSEHNPEVREVVQRIETVTLPALGKDLEAYLKHRFARAGVPLEKVIDRAGVDALRVKLTPNRASGTLLYPLAVANALTAAMNRAAEMKSSLVTAEFVQSV